MMSVLVVCGSHFGAVGGYEFGGGCWCVGGWCGKVWVLSKGWLSLVLCGDGLLVCDVYCVVCWDLHGEA